MAPGDLPFCIFHGEGVAHHPLVHSYKGEFRLSSSKYTLPNFLSLVFVFPYPAFNRHLFSCFQAREEKREANSAKPTFKRFAGMKKK